MERAETLHASDRLKCSSCNSEELVYDHERGEIVCAKCGTVVMERVIDSGREWRAFSYEEYEARARAEQISITYPNLGLGLDEICTHGAKMKTSSKALIERIKRVDRTLKLSKSSEKNVVLIQEILKPIQAKYGLPNVVIQDVIAMYRQIARAASKSFRIRDLAISLLYIVCKKYGIPSRLKDIVKEFNVSRRGIGRIINQLRQYLPDTRVLLLSDLGVKRYIMGVLSKLEIPEQKRMLIMRIVASVLKCCKDLRLTNGRSIYSIIASAIYIMTTLLGMKRRQKEIAKMAGVTDVTIRQKYRELIEKMDIVIYV